MKNRKSLRQYGLLLLTFTILAGCKILDDEIDAEVGNATSAGSAGASSTNAAPAIWGEPETSILVNSQYLFVPDATDADGDVLSFGIVNKPAWAEFDQASGRLQGVPQDEHAGEYPDVVISVTDANSVVSLPGFSIDVTSMPVQDDGDDGATASAPPAISGKPNESAVVGDVYTFNPQSSDPDDDTLSFSIVNKPSWASFDTASGRLTGTPKTSDVGQSEPIELSVTDGTSISGLTPFRINVEAAGPASYTLSWMPPTENADGTPLTNLAGYRIYYGTASGEYTETIEIKSPGLSSYVIDNLAPGTYFLVMTSVNSQDMESSYSSELQIGPAS